MINRQKCITLTDKLSSTHSLATDEYEYLLDNSDSALINYTAKKADKVRRAIYDNNIYIRGLIEISNYCKNDCLYCGIRRSNTKCERYRLKKEDILFCCSEGYKLGFRTFVLQGGEDNHFTDDMICDIVATIKSNYPNCAVTLSLGEKSKESYRAYYDSGADRYLLRHETADEHHYSKLHPDDLTLDNRIRCLYNLKEIGYQVGCGFMVGSPFQTNKELSRDLKFIEEFSPDMCGIGPFIPHHATPFSDFKAGSLDKTLYLLSLIRLIKPNILLPATTALATIDKHGREKGILAGANVIMPNLSPENNRNKYELYDNKAHTNEEAAENLNLLKASINEIGFNIVTTRGDIKNTKNI